MNKRGKPDFPKLSKRKLLFKNLKAHIMCTQPSTRKSSKYLKRTKRAKNRSNSLKPKNPKKTKKQPPTCKKLLKSPKRSKLRHPNHTKSATSLLQHQKSKFRITQKPSTNRPKKPSGDIIVDLSGFTNINNGQQIANKLSELRTFKEKMAFLDHLAKLRDPLTKEFFDFCMKKNRAVIEKFIRKLKTKVKEKKQEMHYRMSIMPSQSGEKFFQLLMQAGRADTKGEGADSLPETPTSRNDQSEKSKTEKVKLKGLVPSKSFYDESMDQNGSQVLDDEEKIQNLEDKMLDHKVAIMVKNFKKKEKFGSIYQQSFSPVKLQAKKMKDLKKVKSRVYQRNRLRSHTRIKTEPVAATEAFQNTPRTEARRRKALHSGVLGSLKFWMNLTEGKKKVKESKYDLMNCPILKKAKKRYQEQRFLEKEKNETINKDKDPGFVEQSFRRFKRREKERLLSEIEDDKASRLLSIIYGKSKFAGKSPRKGQKGLITAPKMRGASLGMARKTSKGTRKGAKVFLGMSDRHQGRRTTRRLVDSSLRASAPKKTQESLNLLPKDMRDALMRQKMERFEEFKLSNLESIDKTRLENEELQKVNSEILTSLRVHHIMAAGIGSGKW